MNELFESQMAIPAAIFLCPSNQVFTLEVPSRIVLEYTAAGSENQELH